MTYTPDQIAQAIIFEGQIARANTSPETTHPVMTPLQIQIGLATALVETNDRDLANPNVPESETYPNDGDGYDHLSTGPFQQQPQWWGTVAEEMDPRLSAAMFYNHLDKDMTLHPGRAPGVYAQDVQGSAYPDRYAQRMDDAVAQYNRLAGTVGPSPWIVVPSAPAPPIFNESNQIEGFNNYSSRNGRTVDLLIIHTEEPKLAPYSRNAQSLYDFLKSTTGNAAVSYHYSIGQNADGTVDVIDIVDTDYECWAVLDSNPDSINYCFSNSSVSLTTDEWMTQFGNAIDVCAYLVVQDAAKYGVPLTLLFPDPNDNSRYPGNPPGVTDHKYVTDYLGDGSHSDVGPNFPFTYFGERIKHYAGQADSGGFMANVSDDDAAIIVAAAKKVVAQDVPNHQWLARGMFTNADIPTTGGVDDTVGMLLNADGNGWNVVQVIGFLIGVEQDVKEVTDASQGKFSKDSYVDRNPWLATRATEFAIKLIAFKASFLKPKASTRKPKAGA